MVGRLIELMNFLSNLFKRPVEKLVFASLFTLKSVLKSILKPFLCNAEILITCKLLKAEF